MSEEKEIKKPEKKIIGKVEEKKVETKTENHEKQLKEMEKEVEEKEKRVVKRAEGGKDNKGDKRISREQADKERSLANWIPKTQLGKDVLAGKVKSLQEIFDAGKKILEAEIVDYLIELRSELLNIGQAKGKFGGGQRRAWRQTQKKTQEGNVITFSVMAVVGDGKGYMGVGYGRAKETLPAKEKALRKAKLNIQKNWRGCGSYDCSCDELHSIPYTVEGKCSGVRVKLMPAAQGTGLVANDELKKVLKLAGIKDIYTKTFGKTRTTINMIKACLDALGKLGDVEI